MKFKNLNVTRNFHAMKKRKYFFPLLLLQSNNLFYHWYFSGKICRCWSEKIFSILLYEANTAESRQMCQRTIGGTCFLIHGFVWAAPGLGVVAHRFARVSLGTLALCRGQGCAEAGRSPSVSEVSEIGEFFNLWLDQRLAEWHQKLSCFWKMGKIGLYFCCIGKDETLQLSNLVPY